MKFTSYRKPKGKGHRWSIISSGREMGQKGGEPPGPRFKRFAIGILVAVAVLLACGSWRIEVGRRGFVVGRPAPRTYVALRPMTYIDEESTAALRDMAASRVMGVYAKDGLIVVDEKTTERLRDEIRQTISPIERHISPGDVLVSNGEVITPADADLLTKQGYLSPDFPWRRLLLTALVVALWSYWQFHFAAAEGSKLALREESYLLALVIVGWALQFFAGGLKYEATPFGFLPVAGWSFLTLPAGMAYHLVTSAGMMGLLIVMSLESLELMAALLVLAVIGFLGYTLLRWKTDTRFKLWKGLFASGLIGVLMWSLAAWSLQRQIVPQEVLLLVAFGAAFSALAVLLLPVWEELFGILSPIRLMDLSSPAHPLLRRLEIEAPGTYHHSLIVGTLAEGAANKLGLNGLLVRVGAYYHDIGKLRRPHFFVENQLQGSNVHDDFSPTLSALSIIAHVREGLEVAREYHLPSRICDFIMEHQGTGCLTYFHQKAQSMGEDLPKEQFCYPGPLPSSKETALVMLADSTEAAVRALDISGKEVAHLEEVVSQVVESKVREGQLKRVDFTLRELGIVKEAFVAVLRSMYHTRQVKAIEEEKPLLALASPERAI